MGVWLSVGKVQETTTMKSMKSQAAFGIKECFLPFKRNGYDTDAKSRNQKIHSKPRERILLALPPLLSPAVVFSFLRL